MKQTTATKRPTPEEAHYGQEQYEKGYCAGYTKCSHDTRKRKAMRERSIRDKFNQYVDYMEDIFAANRKR